MYSVSDGYDTGTVPAFLKKLWTLVEDQSTDDLICWGHNGNSFHVYDQSRFAREVLPHYFKHSNIASFIRQLNMYGFRKVVSVDTGALKVEKDDLEFHHPYFQQGHEELMENIKRKVSPGVKVDSVRLKQEDVSKVLSDVRHLRGKQDTISTRMDTMKRENEALWREVASLRQKHLKQQQIVNKLIQFLVTLVRGNREIPTNPRKRGLPLMLNDSSQIAAKQPKLSRQLSIEENSKPYTVQSPPSTDVTFSQPATSGPIIQEVIDSVPTATQVVDTAEMSPIDLLNVVNPLDLYKPASSTVKITAPAASSTSSVLNKSVTKTATLPTTSVFNSPVVERGRDVGEQLDILQTDIDELKDLLSGGQYNLDSSLLLGLFNPESPLPQVPDAVVQTGDEGNKMGNPGTILGNELIQYEPQDDLSTMPLFDLGDTSLVVPGLDDNGLESNGFASLPESQDPESLSKVDGLLTPQTTPMPEFPLEVKNEELD